MNVVVIVPRKRYDELSRHPIWAVADVRAGRGYELIISPHVRWEERVRAEEAFARLLADVQWAARRRKRK